MFLFTNASDFRDQLTIPTILARAVALSCLLVLGGCTSDEPQETNSIATPIQSDPDFVQPTDPDTANPDAQIPDIDDADLPSTDAENPANGIPDPNIPDTLGPQLGSPDLQIPDTEASDPNTTPNTPGSDVTTEIFTPSASDISDAELVYQSDGYGMVDVLRIDIRTVTTPGICESGDYDGCTLTDVMQDVDRSDDFTPRIDVHFQADDFADDGLIVNAELRQRGGTTRQAPQKSLRIKLEDKDNLWRSERSIYLNKHPFEGTRIRNKVAFDLMADIPNLLSSRTQFANLWIDDGEGPVDYGLFTHVESPGSNYLDKRGFDRDDRLYKVNLFRFTTEDMLNVQVDADGSPLDKDLFERSLDIEAGDDHRPLAKMMRDFHDPSRSFESIIDQYFNRNNVLTWMAVNFLLGQTDAISQNFILYNPLGTERFYFVPWDYDGALTLESEPTPGMSNTDLQSRLFAGYARGSKSDFFSRYYRLPGMHENMVAAATYLRRNYLTDERISGLAEAATRVTAPYIQRAPDLEFNGGYTGFAAAEFNKHVADNLEALNTRFSYPMPPQLLLPSLDQNEWVFQWRAGFDPTGHNLTYELQISTGLDFSMNQIVMQINNIDETSIVPDAPINTITDTFGIIEQRIDIRMLRAGEYFARVITRSSRDPQRFWQVSDNILERAGVYWQGPVVFINP